MKVFLIILAAVFAACNLSTKDKPIEPASSSKPPKEIYTAHKSGEKEVDEIWAALQKAGRSGKPYKIKELLLDSIDVCSVNIHKEIFAKTCFSQVFDTQLFKRLSDSTNIRFIPAGKITNGLPGWIQKRLIKVEENTDVKRFQVIKAETVDGYWTVSFEFIKTTQGYKLYSYYSYGGPCWTLSKYR